VILKYIGTFFKQVLQGHSLREPWTSVRVIAPLFKREEVKKSSVVNSHSFFYNDQTINWRFNSDKLNSTFLTGSHTDK